MTAIVQFSDYAATSLAQNITSGQTTFNVSSSALFPTPAGGRYFYATLVDVASAVSRITPPLQREIVKVTAVAGTAWTVVRGQGGTTPQAFVNGDVIECRLCAVSLDDLGGNFMSAIAPNTLTTSYRATIEPNQSYDLQGNALALTEYYAPATTITVPTAKRFNFARADATFDAQGTASVRGVNYILTTNGTSASSFVAALAGSAIASGSHGGTVASLNGSTTSVATTVQSSSALLAHVGPPGTLSTHLLLTGDGTNAVTNCVVTSNVIVSDGFIRWNQVAGQGAARFLKMLDSVGTEIFYVDSNANVSIGKAGSGLRIKEGSNARMGVVGLNGTTPVTVSTTAVTVASRIFLTIQTAAGTPGAAYVVSRSAGVSFNVASTSPLDTSNVAWMMVEAT